MNITVVRFENYDSVASIREKIASIGEGVILISPPRRMRQNLSLVDWRQLQYFARSMGMEIALLNPDKDLRLKADTLKIAVFSSFEKAQIADWKIGSTGKNIAKIKNGREKFLATRKEQPETGFSAVLKRTIRSGFLLIGFFLFLTFAAFFLPSAHVDVFPEPHIQEVSLNITLTPDVDTPNITGFLPAVKLEKTITGQRTIVSSGSILVGESKARGFITIKNLTSESITLPETTIFATVGENPKTFSPQLIISLPPGQVGITVAVEATDPGVEGNVSAGEVNTTAKTTADTIEVTNPEAFTGGTSVVLPAPTEADYQRLRAELMSSIQQTAIIEFETELTEDYELVPETLVLVATVEEVLLNQVGQASDTISLQLTGTFSILAYKPVQLSDLVRNVLDTSIVDGYHKFDDSLQLNKDGVSSAPDGKTAIMDVNGTRIILQNWHPEIVKNLLRGKQISQAESILASEIVAKEDAKIELFLSWWPRMPWIAQRIIIKEWIGVDG